MAITKLISVTVGHKVYTLIKQGNKFTFCDKEVPKETLEEILAVDPSIEEYDYAINRGETHEVAVFAANLANTMYITDAPCTNDQICFLWNFFCDIGALLYKNSPLIKNNMYFTLQNGHLFYENHIPMDANEQYDIDHLYEFLEE